MYVRRDTSPLKKHRVRKRLEVLGKNSLVHKETDLEIGKPCLRRAKRDNVWASNPKLQLGGSN